MTKAICEIGAFEEFKFHIGEEISSKLNRLMGIIIDRHLAESSAGITRYYYVRHNTEEGAIYEEFELQKRI